MNCAHCGSSFVPPRKDAVYCGESCRNKAYNVRKRMRSPNKIRGLNLVGFRFGRLVVKERTDERKGSFVVYKCTCDCGAETKATTGALRTFSKMSCGCLEKENRKRINDSFGERTKVHGGHGTSAYKSWASMKSRCSNPSEKYYYGKGITVCDRWASSFENFIYDMGYPPPGSSIDRIDCDGDYTPENCRWATPKEQCRNRKSNTFVAFEGREITVAEYAEKMKMSWSGAFKKANRDGIYIGRMVAGGAFVKDEA